MYWDSVYEAETAYKLSVHVAVLPTVIPTVSRFSTRGSKSGAKDNEPSRGAA